MERFTQQEKGDLFVNVNSLFVLSLGAYDRFLHSADSFFVFCNQGHPYMHSLESFLTSFLGNVKEISW